MTFRPDTGLATAKLISLEEMERLADAYRKGGKIIVFTNGCFDLLHVGHVSTLQDAARLGDVLVVALNSDESVRNLKGPSRPVVGERERAAMVAALDCVTHVLIFADPTPVQVLARLRPEVLTKGGTYSADEVVGKELVEAYGGKVVLTRVVHGISTSSLIESIRRPVAAE